MKHTIRAQKRSTKTAVSSEPTTQMTSFSVTMKRDMWDRFIAITPRHIAMTKAVENLIIKEVLKAEM